MLVVSLLGVGSALRLETMRVQRSKTRGKGNQQTSTPPPPIPPPPLPLSSRPRPWGRPQSAGLCPAACPTVPGGSAQPLGGSASSEWGAVRCGATAAAEKRRTTTPRIKVPRRKKRRTTQYALYPTSRDQAGIVACLRALCESQKHQGIRQR